MAARTKEIVEETAAPPDEVLGNEEGAASARRRTKLCSLRFVDVAKADTGFQILVATKNGRRNIGLPETDMKQILDELEAAIHIIRSQM